MNLLEETEEVLSVIDVDDIRVMLWEMLFGEWEFLDGSPCGVEA